MIDVKTILKDLYFCDFDIQKWINNRYKDPLKIIIDRSVIDYIVTPEGLKFYYMWGDILHQVLDEYHFGDIGPDDVVLDLGANIGAFALRAARKAKHVYAVEPLYIHELNANIELNAMQDKITTIPFGVGDGGTIPIKFYEREMPIKTYPFADILKMTGPIDFLKCDIEGTEWLIKPEELKGIRRLEFEVHLGKGHSGENLNLLENEDLIRSIYDRWDCEMDVKEKPSCGYHIHAYPRGSFLVHSDYVRPKMYTGLQ